MFPLLIRLCRSWLTYLLFACALAHPCPVHAEWYGDVMIHAVDSSGLTIDCDVGTFINIATKADLSASFKGLRGTHIPYGTYALTLLQRTLPLPGPPIVGRVEVELPETLAIVIGTRSSPISGDTRVPPDFVISGKVLLPPNPSSLESVEPLWIRLSPLLWNGPNLDVTVNGDGEFHIFKALGGPFLLSVIRGSRLLQVKEVLFEQGNSRSARVLVDLSGQPPAVLHVK